MNLLEKIELLNNLVATQKVCIENLERELSRYTNIGMVGKKTAGCKVIKFEPK